MPASSSTPQVHAVTDDERRRPSSSPSRPSASSRLVDDGHVPAFGREPQRDARADPAAADHERLHRRERSEAAVRPGRAQARPAPRARPAGTRRSAPRTAPACSTYSTVGEKKRDCRRQRGDEPSTIRSTPRSTASSTIALPIERARTISPSHLDAVVGAEQPCLVERGGGALLLLRQRRVERQLERHGDHVQRPRPSRGCSWASLHRRRDHLLADLAELHRHEDAPLNARLRELPARRSRRRARSGARPASGGRRQYTTRPSGEPGRAAVARGPVRDERDDPDRQRRARGRRRAGTGSRRPRGSARRRAPERPPELGRREAQPDHGELGGANASRMPKLYRLASVDDRVVAEHAAARTSSDAGRSSPPRRSTAARRASGGAAARTRAAAARARRASRRAGRSRRSTSSPP